MKPETFKTWSEGVKNLAVTIGLVVAGIWASFVFVQRQEAEGASAELELIRQRLIRTPVINASLKVTTVVPPDDDLVLHVTVTFTNTGSQEAAIYADEDSLRVAKVIFKEALISSYTDLSRSSMPSIPSSLESEDVYSTATIVLLPGQTKSQDYAVRVVGIGLYQIDFRGFPGGSIQAARQRALSDRAVDHMLSVSTFHVVSN